VDETEGPVKVGRRLDPLTLPSPKGRGSGFSLSPRERVGVRAWSLRSPSFNVQGSGTDVPLERGVGKNSHMWIGLC